MHLKWNSLRWLLVIRWCAHRRNKNNRKKIVAEENVNCTIKYTIKKTQLKWFGNLVRLDNCWKKTNFKNVCEMDQESQRAHSQKIRLRCQPNTR